MNEDSKRVLITGGHGQIAPYLAKALAHRGKYVFVLCRSTRKDYHACMIAPTAQVVYGDLLDMGSLIHVAKQTRPAEVYNLAGVTSVGESETAFGHACQVNGIGVLNLISALRAANGYLPKFMNASTAELFRGSTSSPQHEGHPLRPRNAYGISKLTGHQIVDHFREKGGYCCNAILYPQISPRQQPSFVVRKITQAVARLHLSDNPHNEPPLKLGDLKAQRDWTDARVTVEGIASMLQPEDGPRNYVFGSGETHSVEEMVGFAFEAVNSRRRQEGRDPLCIDDHVMVDETLRRPPDGYPLVADAGQAKAYLDWDALTSIQNTVIGMVEHDIELLTGQQK